MCTLSSGLFIVTGMKLAVFVRKRKKNRNFFKTYSLKCVAQKITPYEIY